MEDEQILSASFYMKIGDRITVKYKGKKCKGELVRIYYPTKYSPSAIHEIRTDSGRLISMNSDHMKILKVEEMK